MMSVVTIIGLIVIGFLDLQSKDSLPMEDQRVEDLNSIRPPDPQTQMPKITIMVMWVIYVEFKAKWSYVM